MSLLLICHQFKPHLTAYGCQVTTIISKFERKLNKVVRDDLRYGNKRYYQTC